MSAFGIAHHEIVGYCTGQEFVCTGCIGDADDTDDCTPIFAGDEDAELPCDECGESLIDSYAGLPDGTYKGPSDTDLEREADALGEEEDKVKEEAAKQADIEREEEIQMLEKEIEKLKKARRT